MPGAWGQMGYVGSRLPTDPSTEGTIVLCSTRHQGCHLRVYETPQKPIDMSLQAGSFNMLSDLGTICGDHVGEPSYAGPLPMSKEELLSLFDDEKDTRVIERILWRTSQNLRWKKKRNLWEACEN